MSLSTLALLAFDPEPAHLVGTGGALGALARHWVYSHLSSERFPVATLLVNVVGSFVFALVAFGGASESALQFVGVGACGAFTTFSTFSVDTVQLWERGDRRLAVVNAVGNLVAALAGVGLAWALVGTV
ncbi:fluoride efflux transporter CrcB [Natronobiforma cellulositropha]|uniref:fluoride efflux transporter CrcB n=1 Tax=Natronobiforma cellulositropha TaxID=1679076 RepID=UPI0021D5C5CB|nr:fluoride efflux transporter CrcB [Natronobiforma cellulositropha]